MTDYVDVTLERVSNLQSDMRSVRHRISTLEDHVLVLQGNVGTLTAMLAEVIAAVQRKAKP